MLEQRKARIAEAEVNAEKIKSELVETEGARNKILEEARSEANRLIEEPALPRRKSGSQNAGSHLVR